jgi:uncharacterized protein (TIGR00255 family)
MATLASMTGFGRAAGDHDGTGWVWELRSVNGRTLDLRLRLPSGHDALEPSLRAASGAVLARGNVSCTLTLRRAEAASVAVDDAALERVLALAATLAARIPGAPPPRAEALLALPGVLRAAVAEDAAPEALRAAVTEGFRAALAELRASRLAEGARLGALLGAVLDEIAALIGSARQHAAGQPEAHRARLQAALTELLQAAGPDPARLAQEVAILAQRSDVTEELDRLEAHVQAARALLVAGGATGRKLEFLVQEFGREANTLAAKSASLALTSAALDLKAAIERLREQAANLK